MLEAELWQYHAYDYAWRRVFLNEYDRASPTDPKGKWFDRKLVAEAEQFWKAEQRRPKPTVPSWHERVAAAYRWAYDNGRPMPPGIPTGDPRVTDLVHRFEAEGEAVFAAQDRARAAAAALIIGDGKNPDGSPSAETIAYVELCVRQAKANVAQFGDRNRAFFAPHQGDTELDETLHVLGVRVKPQEDSDDDQ